MLFRRIKTHRWWQTCLMLLCGVGCLAWLSACRSPSLELYISAADDVSQNYLGPSISLAELKQKTVLVSYWATWCAPCKKEIPELNHLQKQAEKNNWAIIGVNYDGLKGEALEKAMKEMDIQFPVFVEDPSQILKLKPVEVVPVTFVLSQQLEKQQVLLGPQSMETFKKALSL